jgi:hypothetical protein
VRSACGRLWVGDHASVAHPPSRELHPANSGKLTVLLAREADTAVVLRRGPHALTQLIHWDLARDAFEPGQWFHGRVHGDRCDVSPDGGHLVYFAAKHHLYAQQRVDPSYTDAWTAVSRPPYFTALALWPNSGSTHHGGGLFERDDVLLLNQLSMRWPDADGVPRHRPHPDHPPPRALHVRPLVVPFGEALGVLRAQRDGWTLADAEIDPYGYPGSGRLTRCIPSRPETIEQRFGALRRNVAPIVLHGAAAADALTDVTWADFDRRGRLLFARDGQLFELPAHDAPPRPLADFRGHVFTPVPPPEWALRW